MLFFSSSLSLSYWMQDGWGDHLCCWLSGSTEYCPIFFSQSLWTFILMCSKDKIWPYTGYVSAPFILLTACVRTSGRSEMSETPRTVKITKMENWWLHYWLNISLILHQKYIKRNDRPGNNYIISCCSWYWPVMLWRPNIRQHTGATGQGCLCSRYLFQDTDILDWWLFSPKWLHW